MATTFTSTQAGSSPDYVKYLVDGVTKVDRDGNPALLDFSLAPTDASFVKLTRGAYITLDRW